MSKFNLGVLPEVAFVCAAALFAVPAHAADETHVYGIANFGDPGECGSSGMTHSVHTSTAAAFAGAFSWYKSVGLWDTVLTRNNSLARGTLFTDASKSASGTDTSASGVDQADVVYVHTHGSHSTSAPWRSSLSMGSSASTCSVRTDSHMLFGNSGGDLDIAVVKACQSGDYDVWKNGGYRQQFSTSGGTFSMWNAFHGDSSCGGHVTDYVGDYAADSFSNGVGENWIDEAYDGAFWWWNDDDCPVSIVMGSSSANRSAMYESGGFRDRKNTGAKTGSTMFYVGGCDPDNGRKLPN